jgi:serine-type D-Ala-D-Ala carboxypeptidase/endopeptidase
MRRLYIAIPLIFFFQLSRGQDIDTIVSHAVDKFKLSAASMGLSVGVVDSGKISFYHFGSIQKGVLMPPNNETIYEIGSVTKTFTSLLLAQAVLEHRAKLTSDLRAFLKENYPNLQYKGVPIGLVQLANLTSGLPNNLPEKIPALKSTDKNGQLFEIRSIHDAYTKHQFLKDLHAVVLTQRPGSAIAHSNTAAQLLGFTLENLYDSSYQKLLAKFITIPIKMDNTYALVPPEKRIHYAHGYNEKGILMPDIPQDAAAAGILKSSLPDMVTYLKLQMAEQDDRIKLAHKPTWGDPGDLAVGLNWMVKTSFDGQRKIWASAEPLDSLATCVFIQRESLG